MGALRFFDLGKIPWPFVKALFFAYVGYCASLIFWRLLLAAPHL